MRSSFSLFGFYYIILLLSFQEETIIYDVFKQFMIVFLIVVKILEIVDIKKKKNIESNFLFSSYNVRNSLLKRLFSLF